jgi:hypothetical protein
MSDIRTQPRSVRRATKRYLERESKRFPDKIEGVTPTDMLDWPLARFIKNFPITAPARVEYGRLLRVAEAAQELLDLNDKWDRFTPGDESPGSMVPLYHSLRAALDKAGETT